MKVSNSGIFTISLDFELYWGVRDKRSIKNYSENLRGVHSAIPQILEVFQKHDIHATWGTVGFLFYKDQNDLKKSVPQIKPHYLNTSLDPYNYIDSHELDSIYHFAPDLIDLISATKHQEIGTHTFSHYYCLEQGQNKTEFIADISAAIAVSKSKGIQIRSLIFPRNQWNEEYLPLLKQMGISSYRGNENHWMYQATENSKQNHIVRAARLIDVYLNISGSNAFQISGFDPKLPLNIPSSRFLRPVSNKLNFLEPLRLKRIKDAMTVAAREGQVFHLWWHPHNFGVNTMKNIEFLEKILSHYKKLEETYNMKSMTMSEICQQYGNI